MKAMVATSFAAAIILIGCCLHRINAETFRRLPLDQQIHQYRRGCLLLEGNMIYLSAIAGHGLDAANAMVEFLKQPDPSFPLEHVMVVLKHVHRGGTDLRNHESIRLLAQIASSASDPDIRKSAQSTLDLINGSAPRRGNPVDVRLIHPVGLTARKLPRP